MERIILINNFKYTFNCKNENKVPFLVKSSIKKRLDTSIQSIMVEQGFKIEKCRFCKKEYPPIDIELNKIYDNVYELYDFEYTKKIYCYGQNKECEGIKYNPNSSKFLSVVLNISESEALAYIKENNKSPFYKENHKNISDYKKSQSRSKEYFIDKHGEDGNKLYEEYINKISYSNSLQRYIDKYGKNDGEKIWSNIQKCKDNSSFKYFLNKNDNNYEKAYFDYRSKNEKTKQTIDNFIKRYGKNGYEKYEEYLSNKSYANSLDYYIEKYGDEKGNMVWNNRIEKYRKTSSKEYYIEKYGEEYWEEINQKMSTTIKSLFEKYGNLEKARRKYIKWLKKITNNHKPSEKSIEFIKTLQLFYDYDFKYGFQNEFNLIQNIDDFNIKIYYYDLFIKELNLIIEYNGTGVHPNKNWSNKKLNEWLHPFNKDGYEIYIKKQDDKINYAKSLGYNVIEVFDDKPINENIKYIINKINELK